MISDVVFFTGNFCGNAMQNTAIGNMHSTEILQLLQWKAAITGSSTTYLIRGGLMRITHDKCYIGLNLYLFFIFAY